MVNQTPEQKERDQIDALLRHASWVVQDNKKTGFAALKTARARLKVYRHAVLRHAFESKLTAQWREEYKEKFDIPQQFLIRIQQEREGREQQFEGQKHSIEDWKASGNEGKNPKKSHQRA